MEYACKFFQAWRDWLYLPPTSTDLTHTATLQLLAALEHLEVDDFFLTTLLDITCPDKVSQEHGKWLLSYGMWV